MNKSLTKEAILGIFAIAMFIIMALFVPGFISRNNLYTMMFQLPEFGLLAIAMMVVILTGGIDLSLTYAAALSGVIMALLLNHGYPILIVIIVGFLVGIACGLLNGLIISYIGVSPILVTLGTMTLYEGIILSITKGSAISGFPDAYSLIGNGYLYGIVPLSLIIFIIFAVITAILLNKTKWGRSVYMSGSNPIATLFTGIKTKKIFLTVYLFAGFLAAISAVIMTSRYNLAKVDLGSSYLLQSIAAAVLGGTLLEGGYGKIKGIVFSVCIFQMLSSGFNLLGVPNSLSDALMGVVLILVLTINFISEKLHANKLQKIGDKQAS
jgi:simple sugar transport system permease protein/ribose transport system permease protein